LRRRLLIASIVTMFFPFAGCRSADQGGATSSVATSASADAAPGASVDGAAAPSASVDAALSPDLPAVVQHHNNAKRTGAYVQPGLTHGAVATMHLDTSFGGVLTGLVRAQPLYVPDGPGGLGAIYVATDSNDVFAFDADTGAPLWKHNLGPPANIPQPGPCGAKPGSIGILGTPIIDLASRTMYLDAVIAAPGDAGWLPIWAHLIHAISIDDGSERAGWPVNPTGVTSNGHVFDPAVENQRGALALDGGFLYLPYGSYGDCGDYQGWVLAVSTSDPTNVAGFAVPGTASGIWASGGVAIDDGNLFVATGNSRDPVGQWAGGEAVLRFPTGGPMPQTPADFYAPANWNALDQGDVDLGVTGVILLDMPASDPPALALALGKDGNAYLLDQHNLGGLGDGGPEGVVKMQVSTLNIGGAAASYRVASGMVVVFDTQDTGVGLQCPTGEAGDLVALLISDGSPPSVGTLWCASNRGHGVPIVTTTDGTSNPIVWVTADSSSQLHGFDGATGAVLFDGGGPGDIVAGMNRFNTVIAVGDRIFVGADNGLHAFSP
jgi:PQQ enzyme-like repeat protein